MNIRCPGCGQKLSVKEETIGRLASCPKCSTKFRIQGEEKEDVGALTVETIPPPPAPPVGAKPSKSGRDRGDASNAQLKHSVLALWALLAGGIGILLPILIPAAFVLGVVSLCKIRQSSGGLLGKKYAVMGIVFGGVACVLWVGILLNHQKICSWLSKKNTVVGFTEESVAKNEDIRYIRVEESDYEDDDSIRGCQENFRKIMHCLQEYAKQDANGCLPLEISDLWRDKSSILKCPGEFQGNKGAEYAFQPNVGGKALAELQRGTKQPLVVCVCHPKFDRVLFSDGSVEEQPLEYLNVLSLYFCGIPKIYDDFQKLFLPMRAFRPSIEEFRAYQHIPFDSTPLPILLCRCRTVVDGYNVAVVVMRRDHGAAKTYFVAWLIEYKGSWKIAAIRGFHELKDAIECFDFSPEYQKKIVKMFLDDIAEEARKKKNK